MSGNALLAQDRETLKTKVDRLAQPIVNRGSVVGLAVGLIADQKQYVFTYGKLSADKDKALDGKTLFEIGSITKVFTGLLLADMIERKLVALEDPVQKLLPETVKVPQLDGRSITLLDLATHMSGLPRLPDDLHFLYLSLFKDPSNPYAEFTVDDLYTFLSNHTLATRPGEKYLYSNLGMGLLGHALACRSRTDYGQLVVERICRPLGMPDTRISLSPDQQGRLAPGHNASRKPVANWDLPALAGAGALRSTVDDMLVFLRANLGLNENPLSAAMALSHVPRHKIDPPGAEIALAWHIAVGGDVYWHNGGTGGYSSYVAFQKAHKIAVVVLANSEGRSVDELGVSLVDVLIDSTPSQH